MEVIKVGIIRGGTGDFYEASLQEGSEILLHLTTHLSNKWKPIDFFVDKNGLWYEKGIPISNKEIYSRADMFWDTTRDNCYILTGSSKIANVSGGYSSYTGDKEIILKEHLKSFDLKIPRHIIIPSFQKDFDEDIERYSIKKTKAVLEKFSPPWRVRSFPLNPKEKYLLIRTVPELVNTIEIFAMKNKSVFVEEYIKGKKEVTHSILDYRGEDVYVFPFLRNSSLDGKNGEKEKIGKLIKNLHQNLFRTHYVNAEFILGPKNDIYLSHFEFSPDISEKSHLWESSELIGEKVSNILEYILKRTLR